MVNSRLFFVVAIALISEHSQAQLSTTLSSAGDAWKFFAQQALTLIRSSIPTVQTFPGAPGNQSLVEAEQMITAVMNMTNHTEILGGLATALVSDITAFVTVKDECSKLGKQQGICNIVSAGLNLSALEITTAIRKLDGNFTTPWLYQAKK